MRNIVCIITRVTCFHVAMMPGRCENDTFLAIIDKAGVLICETICILIEHGIFIQFGCKC